MIGRNLSHYEITAKLGEGGMGEVWRATDTSLNREVQLTHFDEDSIQAFAWSPDRGRMVVTRGRVTRDLVLLKNFR